MAELKIRTTVYDHKVIDVIDFDTSDDHHDWEVEEALHALYYKIIHSMEDGDGRIRVKVDRPLSKDDLEHRMGVVAKNNEKKQKRQRWYSAYREQSDREVYERLKARFEGTS